MSETFKGFEPPTQNWTKMPHALIESMYLIETVGEMKVIYYILRHTWGYHDSEKKITLDEFSNGRKRRDGSRIDQGTGLSTNTIRNGIDRAIKHGFILREEDSRDLARVKHYYRLRSLGDQSLTPRVSEVDSLGSEVDNRSEKETIERNQERAPLSVFNPENTEPFPADSNFSSRDDLPEEPPTKEPRDYVTDVLAHKQRTKGQKSWTIPADAGGADPWANGPVSAFCKLAHMPTAPPGSIAAWARTFEKIARPWEVGPGDVVTAIELIPKDKDHNWRSFTSPLIPSFKGVLDVMIARVRSGETGKIIRIRN